VEKFYFQNCCKIESPLVEALNPSGESASTDTPLATDLVSGDFFAPDHAFYRAGRQMQ
jgi:hypothetical protein